MTTRQRIALIGYWILAVFSLMAQGTNVLVIVLDDQNTWVEPGAGHGGVQTPSLNRLADQGVTFAEAHCQAPICAPSRVSFMSGLRPSTTGLYSLGSTLYNHPTYGTGSHKTMHQYFKEAGYVTATVGKVFHSGAELSAISAYIDHQGQGANHGPFPPSKFTDPALTGTHTYIDWGPYPASDTQMPDYQAVSWATNRMATFAANPATPFFMTVGICRPHVPLYVPQKWFDLYPPGSFDMPDYLPNDLDDTPRFARYLHWILPEPRTEPLIAFNEWTNHTRAYLACVSFVDAMVGRLLDGLENYALTTNTIVVLFSDHGYHLGEKGLTAKTTLWDRATRVPLIVAGPGVTARQVCGQPVELLDLYPTLLDLCGLPDYAPLEGISLKPQLLNPTNTPPRRPAVITHGPNNHSVVNSRYRYIRYADGTEEFYDRCVDPREETNRISHPNYRLAARNLAGWVPGVNAANVSGTSRIVEIGSDTIVRWQGNPIYDPEVPGSVAGNLNGASWIWSYFASNVPGGEDAYFRRSFIVSDTNDVQSAVLTATADNIVELWINGTLVVNDDKWRDLAVMNVSALLQPGTNVIAARAVNFTGSPNPAGFIATLDIQRQIGASDYIATGTDWKTAQSMSGSAWRYPLFDDSIWSSAAVIAVYDSGPWAGQTSGGSPITRGTTATPITDESVADLDGDLLPDWWERHYTGSTNVLFGLNNNYDQDPASDLQEYEAGTDPTNAASHLSLGIARHAQGYELDFTAEPGRDYRLVSSTNFLVWPPVTRWLYGSGQSITNVVPASESSFIRVEARSDIGPTP